MSDITITNDKATLDVAVIHGWLTADSYWARGRSVEDVKTTIDNSLCFGAYDGARQVGFARVITDYVSFGWVSDVFVLESHRGRGIGKRLIEAVVEHPQMRGLKRLVLGTRDAHGLYREYGGFGPLPHPERWMERLATLS